ncbi:MAG: hypothetical protein K2O88_06190 [Paramuribaculum sp.]|nr:hypothetical protein [Paramuribaculum sp.]
MTENIKSNNTGVDGMQCSTSNQIKSVKSKWRIIHDFIKKTEAAELVILKTLSHEPSNDISLERFDALTVMAINTCLNKDADKSSIEDVTDMLTYRINNAFALTQKLAKIVSDKHLSRLQQVLMSAAKSKMEAMKAFEELNRE